MFACDDFSLLPQGQAANLRLGFALMVGESELRQLRNGVDGQCHVQIKGQGAASVVFKLTGKTRRHLAGKIGLAINKGHKAIRCGI